MCTAVGLAQGLHFSDADAAKKKNVKKLSPGAERKKALANDFDYLTYQFKEIGPKSPGYQRLLKETLRKDALILESDKTPVDIVLRRTKALLTHLKTLDGAPSLADEEAQLSTLQNDNSSDLNREQQKTLFDKVRKLRRTIAFKNPLLDFDKLLFIKHHRMGQGERHMVDQYLGFNQKKGGGVYVLENPFSDKPTVKSLLADSKVQNGRLAGKTLEDNGAFISLELDYDANEIYFAFTEGEKAPYLQDGKESDQLLALKNVRGEKKHHNAYYAFTPERNFQIFKMDADGSNLTALTDGKHNDFDPCVLPNGRLVFISDRIEGNQRCGGRYNSTYTLHGMMADGSDIIPFSYHDTNEWHPSVDNNGMIIYTRWDYVDRDSDTAHHIWHCFPDGRDPRSYHGNYPKVRESRPWMEMATRAIPDSHKYLSVSVPHHGQNYGSLIMVDIRKKDDGAMSQVKRITPEVFFPEGESAPGVAQPEHKGKNRYGNREIYGQPWALSEDFYICVYSPTGDKHGIYLVDSFGNKELLYQDDAIGTLDPIPFRARKKPPVIPTQTRQAKADRDGATDADLAMGTVTIMNIYESEYEWPKDTKIKELRIVNVFPKPNAYMNKPNIGKASQSLARGILGIVPVEEDGSVHFKCPTGMAIYFQALDENGMMVQNMRSATYIHPGETLSCIGCHETKQSTPKNTGGAPMALRRAPSVIKPESTGSFPLTFPRLVQPVLYKHCVACHEKEEKAKSLKGISINKISGRSESFEFLKNYAWGKHGGNGALARNKRSYSLPGKEGFVASKLHAILVEKGHHGVKLSPEELRRISAWVDCNSNFFGAYLETEKQARGEVVKPLLGLPKLVPFEAIVR